MFVNSKLKFIPLQAINYEDIMITITINDAANTSPLELRAVAQCLIAIAAGEKHAAQDTETYVLKTPAQRRAEKVTPLPTIIAAADLPDAGAPESIADASQYVRESAVPAAPTGELMREPAIDPKVAFGAVPNVPATPASFTAVAPASPTAPAVPQAISTIPASVPVPPVPPVPASAVQPDEDAPSDAPFDSTGLPWDARIHSRGRSMNATGTWRSKRGVDDATVAAVVAELRAVPGVPAATLGDDVAAAEAAWPFTPPAGIVPPPPPPSVPVSTIVSFPAFMKQYVPHIEPSGPIKQSQVTEILVSHGVPNMALLSARVDLLPTIGAQFDALIAAAA